MYINATLYPHRSHYIECTALLFAHRIPECHHQPTHRAPRSSCKRVVGQVLRCLSFAGVIPSLPGGSCNTVLPFPATIDQGMPFWWRRYLGMGSMHRGFQRPSDVAWWFSRGSWLSSDDTFQLTLSAQQTHGDWQPITAADDGDHQPSSAVGSHCWRAAFSLRSKNVLPADLNRCQIVWFGHRSSLPLYGNPQVLHLYKVTIAVDSRVCLGHQGTISRSSCGLLS